MKRSFVQNARTVGLISLGVIGGAAFATVVAISLMAPENMDEDALMSTSTPSLDSSATDTSTHGNYVDGVKISAPDELRTIESAFERSFQLHGLLMAADERELMEYLSTTADMEPLPFKNQVQTAVVQRLSEFNPQKTLQSVQKLQTGQSKQLVATVFGVWSLTDLDGAMATAKSLDELGRLSALNGILESRADLSDSFKQQIARQLGHELYAMQAQSSDTASSSIKEPRQAWNALVNDAYEDIAQIGSLVQIAQTLVQQNGFEALDWIRDSLVDDTVLEATVRSVLHQVALSDPQAAFQQALTISRDAQDVALPTIVEMWARADPLVAMNRIESLKNATQRNTLRKTLFRAWAENDAQDLFDNLEQIPESMRKNAEQQAMLAVARSSPSDSVTYLAELTAIDRQQALAMEIAEHWSQQDIYGALDWILSGQFTNETTRRRALTEVLRNLVDIDPTLALQTALKQPLSKYGQGLEAMVIEQLARTDLDRAISMLSQVRDGSTKLHAYISAGRALVQNAGYERALELGQQLPDDDQPHYRHSIMWQWAEADPQTLLASLDDLPSHETKAQAAMGLMMTNFRTKALSADQVKYVASLLPKQGDGASTFTFTSGVGSSPSALMQLPEHESARAMQVIEQVLVDRAADGGAVGNAVIFVAEDVEVSVSDSEEEED